MFRLEYVLVPMEVYVTRLLPTLAEACNAADLVDRSPNVDSASIVVLDASNRGRYLPSLWRMLGKTGHPQE